MENLLNEATIPFNNIVKKWIFCGEIEDIYEEFFVAKIPNMDDIWHSKYIIRSTMIPQFISLSMANRILCVGKSIDFLRIACKQTFSFPEKLIEDTMTQHFSHSRVDYLEKLVSYSERVCIFVFLTLSQYYY